MGRTHCHTPPPTLIPLLVFFLSLTSSAQHAHCFSFPQLSASKSNCSATTAPAPNQPPATVELDAGNHHSTIPGANPSVSTPNFVSTSHGPSPSSGLTETPLPASSSVRPPPPRPPCSQDFLLFPRNLLLPPASPPGHRPPTRQSRWRSRASSFGIGGGKVCLIDDKRLRCRVVLTVWSLGNVVCSLLLVSACW